MILKIRNRFYNLNNAESFYFATDSPDPGEGFGVIFYYINSENNFLSSVIKEFNYENVNNQEIAEACAESLNNDLWNALYEGKKILRLVESSNGKNLEFSFEGK